MPFWKPFIKNLSFMLFCGMVGPIFLALYFVAGRELDAPWLLWSGAVITGLIVVVALLTTLGQAGAQANRKRLEDIGILALADVVSATETGMQVNDVPVVRLVLQIQGDGIAPFRAETSTRVSVLRVPTIGGRKLVVLVEPGTQKFEIDWERSALLNGQVPAKFESAADRRTYDLTGQAGPLFEIMKVLRTYGIKTDGMVDIRSNPGARQAIDAILRRTSAAAQPAAASGSAADRLAELERLKAATLVTEAEYAEKRAEILRDI